MAVVNTKLPEIGELTLNKVVAALKKSPARARPLTEFLAALYHLGVVDELVILETVSLLSDSARDSVFVMGCDFVSKCALKLKDDMGESMLHPVFDKFRRAVQAGDASRARSRRVSSLLESRRRGYKFPRFDLKDVKLIENDEEQIAHSVDFDDLHTRPELERFRPTTAKIFEEEEATWRGVMLDVLGPEESDDDDDDESGDEEEADESAAAGVRVASRAAVCAVNAQSSTDLSEKDLVQLRKTIYLVLMSSLIAEESAHKLLKLRVPDAHTIELANMIVECCAQERSYSSYRQLGRPTLSGQSEATRLLRRCL